MEIKYKNKEVENICTSISAAKKYFGGDEKMAISLFSRINLLRSAEVIKDIIVLPYLNFHKLVNKGKKKNFDGYFAIDVKSRKDKWRVILQPLNQNKEPFDPCNIALIAVEVRIVEIKEVSCHYE